MVKQFLLVVTTALALGACGGGGSSSSGGEPEKKYYGTWSACSDGTTMQIEYKSDKTFVLTFKDSESCQDDPPMFEDIITGTYKIRGEKETTGGFTADVVVQSATHATSILHADSPGWYDSFIEGPYPYGDDVTESIIDTKVFDIHYISDSGELFIGDSTTTLDRSGMDRLPDTLWFNLPFYKQD